MKILIMKKSSLIRVALFVLILVGAVVYTKVALSDEVPVYQQDVSDMPICAVDGQEKKIALTIDTTFGDDYTEDILEVLKENHVTATFAVMGAWAEQNPELTQKIVEGGHEIVSHSMNHGNYTEMDDVAVLEDAKAAQTILKETAGVEPTIIRAPYGTYNNQVVANLKSAGMIPIMWSIDSLDWKGEGEESIVEAVIPNIKGGDIILFQNNCQDTAGALAQIVKTLSERDYQCVTLSEMLPQEISRVDENGIAYRN